jgi:ornithine carbamoyltransferase
MSKRDLLTLLDFNTREIRALFHKADHLKERWRKSRHDTPLQGKTLGLLFREPCTLTRVSFETAMFQLGGNSIFLPEGESFVSSEETMVKTIRILSYYLQGLVIKGFDQEFVVETANCCSIPVINGSTDLSHPCRVLSDLFTILEKKKDIEGLRIAWVGGATNVAHSWINAVSRLEFTLVLACPKEYGPRKDVLDKAREAAGDRIIITHEPKEAVVGVDVISTGVWMNVDQYQRDKQNFKHFEAFQVNRQLIALAKPDAIILHGMPMHQSHEISSEVMDDPRCVFLDQAENKMHMYKALLSFLIAGGLEK